MKEEVPRWGKGKNMKKKSIFRAKIDDVGIPQTPTPLASANIGNGDPPPPLRHADVFNGWSLTPKYERKITAIFAQKLRSIACELKNAIFYIMEHFSAETMNRKLTSACLNYLSGNFGALKVMYLWVKTMDHGHFFLIVLNLRKKTKQVSF